MEAYITGIQKGLTVGEIRNLPIAKLLNFEDFLPKAERIHSKLFDKCVNNCKVNDTENDSKELHVSRMRGYLTELFNKETEVVSRGLDIYGKDCDTKLTRHLKLLRDINDSDLNELISSFNRMLLNNKSKKL